MINLNLLPPNVQTDVRAHMTLAAVRRIAYIAIGGTIICAALVYGASFWLSYRTASYEEQLATIRQEQGGKRQTLEQAIDLLNEKANYLSTAQQTDVTWSVRLTDVFAQLPAGIKLTSLSIDPKAKQYAIAGTAATREALIAFRDLLTAKEYILSADIPIATLAQQQNISFTLTATLR